MHQEPHIQSDKTGCQGHGVDITSSNANDPPALRTWKVAAYGVEGASDIVAHRSVLHQVDGRQRHRDATTALRTFSPANEFIHGGDRQGDKSFLQNAEG